MTSLTYSTISKTITKTQLSPIGIFFQVMSTPKTKSNRLKKSCCALVCLYRLSVFGWKYRRTVGLLNKCWTMTRSTTVRRYPQFLFLYSDYKRVLHNIEYAEREKARLYGCAKCSRLLSKFLRVVRKKILFILQKWVQEFRYGC